MASRFDHPPGHCVCGYRRLKNESDIVPEARLTARTFAEVVEGIAGLVESTMDYGA
jgi:hypothetical protein